MMVGCHNERAGPPVAATRSPSPTVVVVYSVVWDPLKKSDRPDAGVGGERWECCVSVVGGGGWRTGRRDAERWAFFFFSSAPRC